MATANDARSVADLHADSWRRHYRGAYSDSFLDGDVTADRLAVWKQRLEGRDPSAATTVAEHGAQLVGFVYVVFDEDPEWGSLVDNLHVAYARKRSGIGSRLMAEAARAVRGHGPGGLYLWVLEQNTDAQAFYEARGGRYCGRRLVQPPGGVVERVNGSPYALQFVWSDPTVLLDD